MSALTPSRLGFPGRTACLRRPEERPDPAEKTDNEECQRRTLAAFLGGLGSATGLTLTRSGPRPQSGSEDAEGGLAAAACQGWRPPSARRTSELGKTVMGHLLS